MVDESGNRDDQPSASPTPLGYAPAEPREPLAVNLARGAIACAILWLALVLVTCRGGTVMMVIGVLVTAATALGLGIAAHYVARRGPPRSRSFALAGLWAGLMPAALTLVARIIIPSQGRPREPAQRVKCASNLRQISQGLQMYANDNGGRFPTDLGVLLIHEDLTSEVMICPSSDDDRAAGPTTQAVAAAVVSIRRHCSYVYVGAGLSAQTATERHIVAHEYLSNHANAGMNVLYGDGTVSWLEKAEAQRVLSELRHGHNPPRGP
jgi:hypothetical protein